MKVAGGVAQQVECLPNKPEALSSNLTLPKKPHKVMKGCA
jgi:hypothetical protein